MRPRNCPYCGVKTNLINRWITGKCSACHRGVNGNMKIKCTQCDALNIVNSGEAKTSGCIQCKYPLNWSIPRGTYIPNYIPLERRVKYALSSIALIAFSAYSLSHNSMDIPYGPKSHPVLVHFSGHGLVLPTLSLMCGVLVGLSVLVDHLDKRPNERIYKQIYDWSLIVGYVSYIAALFFAGGRSNV